MSTYTIYIGTRSDGIPGARALVLGVLDHYLTGYTIVEAVGSYNGVREPSYVVTVIGPEHQVYRAARELAVALDQEEVWVTRVATDLTVIGQNS